MSSMDSVTGIVVEACTRSLAVGWFGSRLASITSSRPSNHQCAAPLSEYQESVFKRSSDRSSVRRALRGHARPAESRSPVNLQDKPGAHSIPLSLRVFASLKSRDITRPGVTESNCRFKSLSPGVASHTVAHRRDTPILIRSSVTTSGLCWFTVDFNAKNRQFRGSTHSPPIFASTATSAGRRDSQSARGAPVETTSRPVDRSFRGKTALISDTAGTTPRAAPQGW